MLVRLTETRRPLVPERLLRAGDFADGLGETNNPDGRPSPMTRRRRDRRAERLGRLPLGREGKWNLEEKDGEAGRHAQADARRRAATEIAAVDFPYFGGRAHEHFVATDARRGADPQRAGAPDQAERRARRRSPPSSTCSAPTTALDRGLGGGNVAQSTTTTCPTRRPGPRTITGVKRDAIITVAREFALNAEKTNGRSMVILGAGINHWYHMDMAYRGIINMLVMCGCIGQSGGGWSHYVGQEKLRPQTGWTPLAFALDWAGRRGR